MPTYNEAENISAISRAVIAELEQVVPGDHRLLIVDDNSPDGTGQMADELAQEFDAIEVLHRPSKNGLGRAYLSGFTHAMERGAELLIEMDADFSHDPRYLRDLIATSAEADLVLGSRYVRGGSVRNWGPLRKLISRGGSMYARWLLGVNVRDLTGGFKCIHRHVLETIGIDTVEADGYVFQIEVTYRAILAGFIVREVPIMFVDRSAGTSKMSWRIALEAMLLVPRLRRSTHS